MPQATTMTIWLMLPGLPPREAANASAFLVDTMSIQFIRYHTRILNRIIHSPNIEFRRPNGLLQYPAGVLYP